MPTVLSPRQWNAIVDYDQWDDPFTPDDGVALHHGGGTDYAAGRAPFSVAKEIQQLQQWEGYHIYSKGWRGLAYGWGVGQTGTIFRIRGFNSYGAHTGDIDGDGIANNSEIIPIIFVGSGNHHSLSPAAQDSIAWLRQNVLLPRSPRAVKLWGHQEISPATGTTCPGPKLMEYVRANRVVEDVMNAAQEAKLDQALALLAALPENAAQAVQSYGFDGSATPPKPSHWQYQFRTNQTANAILVAVKGLNTLDPQEIAQAIVALGVGQAVVDALVAELTD